jgi:protein O-mannosyl-transferase
VNAALQRLLANRGAQVALLCLVAIGVYAYSLTLGFAYDDVVIVKGDARVTQFQLGPILTRPYWSSPGFALYRPFVTLSFALDWAIANGNPAWFHAVNALWHAVATAMLFALLLAWFDTTPAMLGTLLFAVHPVHVEAVANVVGRAELMAAALFLLACALWAHQRPHNRAFRIVLVCLLFAVAILCKEIAVTLPAILVLIDATREKWSLRKLPGYVRSHVLEYTALTVTLAAVLVLRSRFAGGATPTQLDPVMEIMQAPGDRVRTALQVWPHILRLMVFPNELLADYGPRVLMPADGWTALGLLGLVIFVGLLFGGLLAWERGSGLVTLTLLWLPITLLPVANLFFPIGVMLAERTLYIPSVAVSIALALAWTRATAPHSRTSARPHFRTSLLAAGFALGVILMVVRIQTRTRDWDSTDSIMMAQLRDRPQSFRAVWHAARMSRRDRKPQLAIQQYQQALQLWPYRERMVVEAAAYLTDRRDLQGSQRIATWGVQRWPKNLELQRLIAANALDQGDTVLARQAIAAGLSIAPSDSLLRKMSAAVSGSVH